VRRARVQRVQALAPERAGLIQLENRLFKVVTHEDWQAETFLIKLDERPLVLINRGGFKRGQLGNLDLYLDAGKDELVFLDRLFHRPQGTYDWSHYMRWTTMTRWAASDFLAGVGFSEHTLREAAKGKIDAPIGAASLSIGVTVFPDLDREMVLYVNPRHTAPIKISGLQMARELVDFSMRKKNILHWVHTAVGDAWIKPLLPLEQYPTFGDSAPTGLAKAVITLKKLGFDPLAANLAFADRIKG